VKLREVLTPRALAAWAGTDRLSALAYRLPPGRGDTELTQLFALLVAGDTTADPRNRARARARVTCTYTSTILGDLEARGLIERVADDVVRARYSILPLGRSLLVCDRLDADFGLDVVSWPDDSSYHLALSIPPGRRRAWLDIGTGSAFAPLLRPELAEHIVCTEINPHACELAKLGLELSAIRAEVRHADLTDGITGTFDLVTCNAPIPSDVGPRWRSTADVTLFARLFDEVPRVLAPGGRVVVHGALAHLVPATRDLRGNVDIVSYVPDGGTQFGILWWEPDGQSRHEIRYRELTADRPHLTHADRSP
jgi:SAM-dependent methyltransferase